MPFKGNEGKQISPTKAKKYMMSFHRGKQFSGVKGGFFGKKLLLKLLSQRDCVGIRYFHARNDKKQHTLILAGEDKNGKLMDRIMIDDGPLCPPWCG
jgi:hypothetical protein